MDYPPDLRGYFPRVNHQPLGQEDNVSALDRREPLTPLDAAAWLVQLGREGEPQVDIPQ